MMSSPSPVSTSHTSLQQYKGLHKSDLAGLTPPAEIVVMVMITHEQFCYEATQYSHNISIWSNCALYCNITTIFLKYWQKMQYVASWYHHHTICYPWSWWWHCWWIMGAIHVQISVDHEWPSYQSQFIIKENLHLVEAVSYCLTGSSLLLL